jgi:hypothetical protein
VGGGQRRYVAGAAVVDRLNLQGVDDQPDLLHLGLGRVEHLLSQALAFADDLLDRHGADDRPQVAGEDPPGEDGHAVLVLQEAAGRVGDALLIVAHLEGDHGPALERDALLGHALFGHLGLLHGQGQGAHPAAHRHHERAVTGDYPER